MYILSLYDDVEFRRIPRWTGFSFFFFTRPSPVLLLHYINARVYVFFFFIPITFKEENTNRLTFVIIMQISLSNNIILLVHALARTFFFFFYNALLRFMSFISFRIRYRFRSGAAVSSHAAFAAVYEIRILPCVECNSTH